jgi:hypothetical protein
MPLAGLLGVLDRDVESEVEPPETTALTADLNVGRVAIGSGYDVISMRVPIWALKALSRAVPGLAFHTRGVLGIRNAVSMRTPTGNAFYL